MVASGCDGRGSIERERLKLLKKQDAEDGRRSGCPGINGQRQNVASTVNCPETGQGSEGITGKMAVLTPEYSGHVRDYYWKGQNMESQWKLTDYSVGFLPRGVSLLVTRTCGAGLGWQPTQSTIGSNLHFSRLYSSSRP